jgi:hypothetical protein
MNSYPITSKIDGWYFANIVFGGLIGMVIVDPATGAMFKLPDAASVSLDEKESKQSKLNNDLIVASIDSLTEAQKKTLIRIK